MVIGRSRYFVASRSARPDGTAADADIADVDGEERNEDRGDVAVAAIRNRRVHRERNRRRRRARAV
jgi:hypothetical protein